MIQHELIKEPTNLYIKYSVIIDLDTLEIIYQKLVQSNYTKIEYRFSVRNTKYTCNKVSEVRTIFSNEGISEIDEIDISCRNEECKSISIRFGKSSDYYLNIYSLYPESNALMKEILAIIEEKNIQGFKFLTKIIGKGEKLAWTLLILDLSLGTIISKLPSESQLLTTQIFFIVIIFLVAFLVLSSKQETKIISRKAPPFTLNWVRTFTELIVGICASLIAGFIANFIAN